MTVHLLVLGLYFYSDTKFKPIQLDAIYLCIFQSQFLIVSYKLTSMLEQIYESSHDLVSIEFIAIHLWYVFVKSIDSR